MFVLCSSSLSPGAGLEREDVLMKANELMLAEAFRKEAVSGFEKYLPRIVDCLQLLSEEEIWWRPNEASNSAGNLVLHLCGNARQWIVSGVGGVPDVRRRQEEFDERGPLPRAAVLETLDATFADIDRTLRAVDADRLLDRRVIQGT